MLDRIYIIARDLVFLAPFARTSLTRAFYDWISSTDRNGAFQFLNYGYVSSPDEQEELELLPEDEPDRYQIQLYYRVANMIRLEGKTLLEIGCGRGGGASYITRYLKPRSMVAIDLSDKAIDFCKRRHAIRGLLFCRGDSEDLDFPDQSFDAVLNVESSSNYTHPDRFVREAYRVLKPGGYLLWADSVSNAWLESFVQVVGRCGFRVHRREDITENVLRALNLDQDRKQRLIEIGAPRYVHGMAREIAVMPGSTLYVRFQTGALKYWVMKAQKPDQEGRVGAACAGGAGTVGTGGSTAEANRTGEQNANK